MSFPLELGSLQKDGALGTLEKQLICPICLEVFTKPVVILPCQHNLCRKCANELYQPSLFQVGVGGRFRCPSCRHEVVLDRHGVYGLQRNLLVENIIDVYKQEAANSKPTTKPIEQPTCVEHVGEKVNIYCITCQVPTCSLCKVFGAHKSCQVAALSEVYQQQKAELSDGIGSLVATNEQVQAVINELEEVCRSIEETSKSLKQTVCEKFDRMHAILEERRQIMTQRITYEQEEKTGHARSLSSTYGEHVDANLKLVQTAVQTMEEAEMSVFMQTSRTLIEKVTEAANSCTVETLEPGYENMDHYQVDFNAEEQILHQLDFMKIEEEVQDIPEDLELEPDTEVELDSAPSQDINEEPDEDPKVESWETKDPDLETKDNTKEEPIGFIDTKKGAHGDQEGLSTQQAVTLLFYFLALVIILQRVWGHIQCIICI
ncbi:tripartite motif containing 101 [Chanos chanos]|uniref:RING-type E3 ubiquitin transferase n=1 Tax=Chanos chanos TaxID=29144 RepID=A0A6J2UXH3_CHACN|nr:tripartite motif-containing protein 54-like [Chanos chanos]